MAVLVAILAPQLIGQLSKARDGVCQSNRAQFVRLYNIYVIDAYGNTSLEGFLTYAEEADLRSEEICPTKGTCTFHISDHDRLVIECSIHTGSSGGSIAPPPITIEKFTSKDDALVNAEKLYNGAIKYITDLVAQYPSFTGISALTISATSNTHVVLTAADGSKQTVYLAKDLNSLVNPNGLVFGDVKVYFVMDANNKPTTKVDYVAIKSGDIWAKYGVEDNTVVWKTGTGAADGWKPGDRP